MSRRARVVNGWTIAPAGLALCRALRWCVFRDGSRPRFYLTLADARRGALASTTELVGGVGIL